jgi:hypothetical protein
MTVFGVGDMSGSGGGGGGGGSESDNNNLRRKGAKPLGAGR